MTRIEPAPPSPVQWDWFEGLEARNSDMAADAQLSGYMTPTTALQPFWGEESNAPSGGWLLMSTGSIKGTNFYVYVAKHKGLFYLKLSQEALEQPTELSGTLEARIEEGQSASPVLAQSTSEAYQDQARDGSLGLLLCPQAAQETLLKEGDDWVVNNWWDASLCVSDYEFAGLESVDLYTTIALGYLAIINPLSYIAPLKELFNIAKFSTFLGSAQVQVPPWWNTNYKKTREHPTIFESIEVPAPYFTQTTKQYFFNEAGLSDQAMLERIRELLSAAGYPVFSYPEFYVISTYFFYIPNARVLNLHIATFKNNVNTSITAIGQSYRA